MPQGGWFLIETLNVALDEHRRDVKHSGGHYHRRERNRAWHPQPRGLFGPTAYPSCSAFPLLRGIIVTGIIVYVILMFERFGFRPVELIIGNLVAIIALCYLVDA
jgi:hypothetical protein